MQATVQLAIQYLCKEPRIDDATQEPANCKDMIAWVECLPAPNVSCRLSNGTEFRFSGEEVGFNQSIPCRNVSGYSYKIAVALSLFLGWLGADRFYLGYPALGLLKFCTVGFCGIGSLADFMLISMQGESEKQLQPPSSECCHFKLCPSFGILFFTRPVHTDYSESTSPVYMYPNVSRRACEARLSLSLLLCPSFLVFSSKCI
ncbi:TM2 domain-containing protein 1 isoform X2 [Salmo trutta]|uniref:TM2 domain-containing protein 1 isoform X2 n=1 Tax=Salmo trutta TaxID=8032 RepID=UPI001131540D|nr:TM2 domain-containing protein 1-like isoform X2 [Salmo trutta]